MQADPFWFFSDSLKLILIFCLGCYTIAQILKLGGWWDRESFVDREKASKLGDTKKWRMQWSTLICEIAFALLVAGAHSPGYMGWEWYCVFITINNAFLGANMFYITYLSTCINWGGRRATTEIPRWIMIVFGSMSSIFVLLNVTSLSLVLATDIKVWAVLRHFANMILTLTSCGMYLHSLKGILQMLKQYEIDPSSMDSKPNSTFQTSKARSVGGTSPQQMRRQEAKAEGYEHTADTGDEEKTYEDQAGGIEHVPPSRERSSDHENPKARDPSVAKPNSKRHSPYQQPCSIDCKSIPLQPITTPKQSQPSNDSDQCNNQPTKSSPSLKPSHKQGVLRTRKSSFQKPKIAQQRSPSLKGRTSIRKQHNSLLRTSRNSKSEASLLGTAKGISLQWSRSALSVTEKSERNERRAKRRAERFTKRKKSAHSKIRKSLFLIVPIMVVVMIALLGAVYFNVTGQPRYSVSIDEENETYNVSYDAFYWVLLGVNVYFQHWSKTDLCPNFDWYATFCSCCI